MLIATCTILTIIYAALMLVYLLGWLQQPVYVANEKKRVTKISVIIPARNEANNIAACIQSVLSQDYPQALYELIVIDDHSEDDTAGIVASFANSNVRCISLAEHIDAHEGLVAYKKKALSIGIGQATGELIITTDADCTMSENWLKTIASKYEEDEPVMIVAPVNFACSSKAVELFQSLDFMSLQGITAASHKLKLGNMSNGANLAFSKQAYVEVEGYSGIDHLASGDDYLLMMKMHKAYPERISYLKSEDAVVYTPPQPDWSSFIAQRVRWASKSGKYDDTRLNGILMFVYLFNLSLFVLFITALFLPGYSKLLLVCVAAKIVAEIIFLLPVAGFFYKRKQLWLFPLFQPLHIFYIVVAGLLGFVGVYSWKGRRVK